MNQVIKVWKDQHLVVNPKQLIRPFPTTPTEENAHCVTFKNLSNFRSDSLS